MLFWLAYLVSSALGWCICYKRWSIQNLGWCVWYFHKTNVRISVYILWINLAKSIPFCVLWGKKYGGLKKIRYRRYELCWPWVKSKNFFQKIQKLKKPKNKLTAGKIQEFFSEVTKTKQAKKQIYQRVKSKKMFSKDTKLNKPKNKLTAGKKSLKFDKTEEKWEFHWGLILYDIILPIQHRSFLWP